MHHILIVEDDRDLARVTARFLESSGLAVQVVGSAEDAYDALGRSAFDCLVVDVNLPGDDGFALCRNLRGRSGVPVLFASARVEPDARVRALEEGGDVYLPKPFGLRELLAQVQALIRRSEGMTGGAAGAPGGLGAGAAAPAPLGPFQLDEAAGRILKRGEEVALSPREYQLAAFLMRHAGEAVSRDALLAEVWGAFAEVEAQTVAVHMSWLRAKLEDDPAHPTHFKTVRGQGYRFDADGVALEPGASGPGGAKGAS